MGMDSPQSQLLDGCEWASAPSTLVSAHVGRPAARRGGGPATERRAWEGSSPRLRAVASSEVKMAEMSAPSWERKPPVTLRWMTDGRRSCSEALFVGGTSGRSKKTNRLAGGS